MPSSSITGLFETISGYIGALVSSIRTFHTYCTKKVARGHHENSSRKLRDSIRMTELSLMPKEALSLGDSYKCLYIIYKPMRRLGG
ncbi:hypothetical protein GOBAR_DD28289 [Gossypium barbadense]|nr:hypothetical protein GOBAR_DD28289 [Gossypium barbadense]